MHFGIYFLLILQQFFSIAGDEAEEKNVPVNEKELVLDGGFLVPQINSFGHTFRSVTHFPFVSFFLFSLFK